MLGGRVHVGDATFLLRTPKRSLRSGSPVASVPLAFS